MEIKPLLITLLTVVLLTTGCGGGGSGGGGSDNPPLDNPPAVIEERGIVGARSIATVAELPDCDSEIDGQLFYVEGTGSFYVCNGSIYQPIDLTGPAGRDGSNAISISWLGTLSTVPSSPSLNNAYYNDVDRIAYIWDGSSWQILAQDGSDGSDGENTELRYARFK